MMGDAENVENGLAHGKEGPGGTQLQRAFCSSIFLQLKPYSGSSGVGEAAETNKKSGVLSLTRMFLYVTHVTYASL